MVYSYVCNGFLRQIQLGSYQPAHPVLGILRLCNYLQNAGATTYILGLQLYAFTFYNKHDMEIRYTYYLKLEKGESFTLFDGLNVPKDFDNNRKVGDQVIHQMDFFDGLTIEIKADAIQVEGFDSPKEAFEALEAAHPMN